MNDYKKLEKLLESSPMNEYDMYTREDLLEFGLLVVKECVKATCDLGRGDVGGCLLDVFGMVNV